MPSIAVYATEQNSTVVAEPSSVEVNVAQGARGARGSRIFFGPAPPDLTLSPEQYGEQYLPGDIYIVTAEGSYSLGSVLSLTVDTNMLYTWILQIGTEAFVSQLIGVTDHSQLVGLTVGDDHTQYLHTDGRRGVTGSLSVSGNVTIGTEPTLDSHATTKAYVDGKAAFPLEVTYDADPGRPEWIIYNNYPHTVSGRNTTEIWANGELTNWVNEWGGIRLRVANTSSWDGALRLIGAVGQSGDYLECQDYTRQKLLMRVTSNGTVVAPNVKQPTVIVYGNDPVPPGVPAPLLLARVGGYTTKYNYFLNDDPGNCTVANGWDEVRGVPVYDAAAAYGGAPVGLRFSITTNNPTDVTLKPSGASGYWNEGYTRFRFRIPNNPSRRTRLFATRSSATGGTRAMLGIDTARKLEIGQMNTVDGTVTALVTSSTIISTNTWYDVGVYWKRNAAGSGVMQVRIYNNPASDTASESFSTNTADFVASGGDHDKLSWGLIASGTGNVNADFGMIAYDKAGWITSSPPAGSTASLYVWDGAQEIPVV